MPYSFDPEDWTPDYYIDREFKKFELKPYQRQAIQTIKNNLERKAYKERKNCEEHLSLLNDIANTVKMAITNERSIGRTNYEAEDAYNDLKTLLKRLDQELDDLNN